MPSLHKRKRSPYWVVAYTDAKGRRLKKSTKTTDYAVAQQFALDLEKAVKAKREALREKDQRQRVFCELYEETRSPGGAPQNARTHVQNIPNQREIASMLGINQSTVSMALRGDRRISAKIRQKIQETASRLGYHTNAYVNVLMSHIRSGRKLSDKGVIAMLVDSPSEESWHSIGSYSHFHQGVVRRAEELGFHVETFFLQSPDTSIPKIDRVLYSRGIQGVIFAPPYRGNRSFNLHWERFAAVGVGFGWEEQELDRVVFDNNRNFIIAFEELLKLGYRRIGTVMDRRFTQGNRCGTRWFPAFLECQYSLVPEFRIPIFSRKEIGDDNIKEWKPGRPYNATDIPETLRIFRQWLNEWRPDALLTLIGVEHEWLHSLQMQAPKDIGLACMAQPFKPYFSGIEEMAEIGGATAVEQVTSKIARNEFGFSSYPKSIMIEGRWNPGSTVCEQK